MDLKLEIKKIAKMITSDSDYVWDPEHEKKPEGSGWEQTENGWSKTEKGVGGFIKKTKENFKQKRFQNVVEKIKAGETDEKEYREVVDSYQSELEQAEKQFGPTSKNTLRAHSMLLTLKLLKTRNISPSTLNFIKTLGKENDDQRSWEILKSYTSIAVNTTNALKALSDWADESKKFSERAIRLTEDPKQITSLKSSISFLDGISETYKNLYMKVKSEYDKTDF